MEKTGAIATFTGDVNAGGLTINGSGGTLNLGNSHSHTITTSVTRTAGTLNLGTSTLNFAGTSITGTGGTFQAAAGTFNYNAAGNQTVAPLTYYNLTLSGSGSKGAVGATVLGILSMEGTATVPGTPPTFGPAAGIQYNTSTDRTVGNEWRTPFNSSGGIVIANTGIITLSGDRSLGDSVPLTINPGATLAIGNVSLTTGGDLDNNGTLTLNSTKITLFGTANQSIDGFTTTDTVIMSKTGGTATFQGAVTSGGLTLNGSGGTLDLGSGFTHNINGNLSMTLGTLVAGTNTLFITGSEIGSGATFVPGTSTVNYSALGSQNVGGFSYYNLVISGTGSKSTIGAVTVSGNLNVNAGASMTVQGYDLSVLGTTTVDGGLTSNNLAGTKTFTGLVTVNGTWSSTSGSDFHFRGGLTHNGASFNAGTGSYIFETNNQSIGGTSAINLAKLTADGIILTNDGNVTVNTDINGTGLLMQGTGATLNIAGTMSLSLNAVAANNTVNYSDTADQPILAVPYYNLGTGGSGNKTTSGDFTVNGDLSVGSGTNFVVAGFDFDVIGNTTIGGALTHASSAGSKIYNGLVMITAGQHDWINSGNADIRLRGGLIHNGRTFTAGTGIYHFEGNDQVIGGVSPITLTNATVTAITLTNTGTLTITTNLGGTGTLQQNAGAVLNLAGTSPISHLTASADPNTVNYTGAGQTVIPTTYHHLGLSGTGVKDLSGVTTINGNLTLTGSVGVTTVNALSIGGNLSLSNTSTFTVGGFDFAVTGATTLNNTATLRLASAAGTKTFTGNVTINSGTSWYDNDDVIPVSFGGDLLNNGIFYAGGGVHTFTGANNSFGGTATIAIDNIIIDGTYTNNGTLTAGSSLSGAGSLTQGAPNPTLNIGGTLTLTTLTATSSPNTVRYSKFGPQTIRSMTFHHLGTLGTSTKTLGGAVTVNGDLTIGAGTTLDVSGANYDINLGGGWTNSGAFTAQAGTVTLQGTTAQSLNGITNFNNLVVNNTAGVSLASSQVVNGVLTLTNGIITTTGTRTLTLGLSATVSGANSSRYINGTLQKTFPTGAQTFVYPIGDASAYTPVTLAFANITVSGGMAVKSAGVEHSNIGTSGIDPALDVNRNWSFTTAAGLAFSTYDATFTFVTGDKDAGVNPSTFIVKRNISTTNWATLTIGTRTALSTQATGITAAGTFAIGQPDVTASVVTNVYSTKANGAYSVGVSIPVKVTFNELVVVTGIPQLTLHTAGSANQVVNYTSGTGTNTLTFTYTVQAEDASSDLDYLAKTSLVLNGGTIRDYASNAANLTLPTPGATGSLSANANLVIDTTGPETTITGKPTDPNSDTTPEFSFSGNDGTGSGVVSYQCKTELSAYTACTSPFTTVVLPDGPHNFFVYAVDAAGNTDPTPATYTWVVDSTAPDTSMTGTLPAWSNDATPSLTFSGNDGTGSGIASFQCQLDSGSYSACTSPYTTSLPLLDGPHTFNVYAIDQAGNADASPAAYAWTQDTVVPSTMINVKPPSFDNDTTPTFQFAGDDGLGSGIGSFMCKVDGAAYTTCSSPFTTSALGEGVHHFYVYAIDRAGNADPSAVTYSWTIDTTAPNTFIDGVSANPDSDPTPTFTFHGNDSNGVAGFECKMDSGSWITCTSGITWSPALAGGLHTFSVRAVDAAGNVDTSPATYIWTLTTTYKLYLPVVIKN